MSKRARSVTPTWPSTEPLDTSSNIPPPKRAKTTATTPSTGSVLENTAPATAVNAPAPASIPPAPKLEVRLDISLQSAVLPPNKFSKKWRCTLDSCPNAFDTTAEWMRHVQKDYRGLWYIERQIAEVVTGYAPPPEEMFGSSVGGWRPERDEQLRVRDEESPPPSPFPILDKGAETSKPDSAESGPARWREDSWVREIHGSPYPPTSAWSGEDSWIRARDGPPLTPEWRRDWSPSRFTDASIEYGEDQDDEVDEAEAGDGAEDGDVGVDGDEDNRYSPEVEDPFGCDCDDCGGVKQTTRVEDSGLPNKPAAAKATPPLSRFEIYGSFNFTQLPGELRNAVYAIAIEDAVQARPEADRRRWRTQPLFYSSRAVRGEALCIYASAVHFDITFSSLDRWMKLVGPPFLRHIRKINIAFAPYEEITRIFDFTNVYRLACLLGPKPQLRLTDTDAARRTVDAKHWSMTENHVNLLQELVDGARKEKLAPLFEGPSTLSEIYVNVKGQLISAKATSNIWVTYEDLKDMFKPPSDFRLTVGAMPWQGTSLASTMAPRTTRASKEGAVKEVVKEEGATGGFGGFGGAGSFGGTGTLAGGWGSKSVAGWTFMQRGPNDAGLGTRTASAWAPPETGFKFQLAKDADHGDDESD